MSVASTIIGLLGIKVTMDNAEMEDGARESERLLDRLATRLGITAGVAAAAGTMIGNAMSDAAVAIVDGVKQAIDSAEEMADAAEKFGVSIETVSAVVKEGQVSLSTLTTALDGLQESLVKTAQGDASSTAARAFQALGISATDASGNVKKTADVLDEIADKFAQYQDGAQKNALATYVFGTANKQLISVLNKGADGIQELTDDAEELGVTLDAKAGRQAQDFKDTMEDIGKSWDVLYTQLAIKILPSIKSFSQLLADWVKGPGEQAGPAATKIGDAINFIYRMTLEASAGIQRLGIKLKAFWDSGVALFTSAEVKKIQDEAAAAVAKIDADLAERKAKLDADKKGDSDPGKGWKAEIEERTKANAPLIKSTRDLAAAQGEWNRSVSAGEQLAKKVMTPYELLGQQIDQLRDAYDAGKISADQLAVAQKRLTDEANIAFAGGAELIAKNTSPYQQLQVELQKLAEKYQAGAISATAFGQAQQQATLVAVNAYAGAASNIAGSLSQVFSKSKGVAIASAIINSFQAASNALAQVPYPLNFAAAAAALAAGFAQVANIRRTTESSGGGGGGGGGAASAPGLTQAPQTLRIEGINPNQLYSGTAVRGIVDSVNDFVRNGGVLLSSAVVA